MLLLVRFRPTNMFVEPLIVVVPVPLGAPKPIVFPVMVAVPVPVPIVEVMPAYVTLAVKMRGAVWKILLLETVVVVVLA